MRGTEGECIIVANLPKSDLVKINNSASVLIWIYGFTLRYENYSIEPSGNTAI